jgi:Cof subfamily protein (haloacid dehalogenase superfamily)
MKLLFFDIDGTLATRFNVPESTRIALEMTRNKGNKVIITTGRVLSYAKAHFDDLCDGYICFNGRYGELDGQVLYDHPFKKEEANLYKKRVLDLGASLALYTMKQGYYFGKDDFELAVEMWDEGYIIKADQINDPIYNFDVLFKDDAQFASLEKAFQECLFSRHGPRRSADTTFYNHNKGTAMVAFAKALNVDIKDTYAFGDGINDLLMFKNAGHSIAMGNAREAVKKQADFVTTTIDNHGIRNGLKHYELI